MKVSNARLVNTSALFFVVLFLSACSMQSVTQLQNKSASVMSPDSDVLPEKVGSLLTENNQDISITIPSGIYQDKTLIAGMTYFAASGRLCRQVVISDQSTKEKHIACRSEATRWQLVRAVM
ncbi:hypothetical protein [Amphritea sp.]|uniref:hypothetical protein n=1 Tax=Amphritea sp. TaxID=1872502 RepID=UPI0035666597